MPSGPVPLSGYQYNQDAANTGVGSGVDGAGGLAQAIIGNPQALAQAKYLGAQTGLAQTQTAAGLADNAAVAQFQQMAADPTNYTPAGVAKMLATAAGSPTLSARAAQLINASVASQASLGAGTGAPGSPTIAQASNEAALTGQQSMGNTPTGQGLQLANNLQQAGIGAGATVESARIGAGASEADTAMEVAKDEKLSMTETAGPNGPVYTPTVQAAGMPAYDSAVAQQNNAPMPYLGPGGSVRLGTAGGVEAGGYTPAPASVDQANAGIIAGRTNMNANVGPMGGAFSGTPPAAVAPVAAPPPGVAAGQTAGAPVPTQGPSSVSPDQRQQIADAIVAKDTGVPLQGPTDPAQAQQMDVLATQRLEALAPGVLGKYQPSPFLMNAVRAQAAWLLAHDPTMRGNTQAALTTAITNVAGAKGQNLQRDGNYLSPGTPSYTDLRDPSQIVWPAQMPVPNGYTPQQGAQGMPAVFTPQGAAPAQGAPAPASAPTPPASGMAGAFAPQGAPAQGAPPAPAGVAPAPAQAAQNMTQPQIMAQAQDAINQITASNDPPAVQQAKIAAIRQRLVQLGALPAMPSGTPH